MLHHLPLLPHPCSLVGQSSSRVEVAHTLLSWSSQSLAWASHKLPINFCHGAPHYQEALVFFLFFFVFAKVKWLSCPHVSVLYLSFCIGRWLKSM